ncbi:MAG TPA: hypothetical protein VGN60_08330 [Devosia sp.]|nr:hypothetical protein [Devosia sp.]
MQDAFQVLKRLGDNASDRLSLLHDLVETEDPESDSVLQILLAKEVAFASFQEYMRRSVDFTLGDAVMEASAATALRFGKLHLQYQAEYEKTQRKGIQRIILQNNAPVNNQTIFGDAGGEPEATTIDSTANAPRPPVRARVRKDV